MRNYLLCIILVIGVTVLGCSGRDGTSNPIVPNTSSPTINSGDASSHVLWSMVQVIINPTGVNTADVDIVPLRGTMFNCNVQQFLSPPLSPTHLMTFEFLPDTDFPSGYVDVRVGLQHPFPGLAIYRGFDVRGIFMADGTTSGEHDSGIVYANPQIGGGPADDAYMLNPDGYARWWNYTEFTDPMSLLSFKPGKLGNDLDPSAIINPFKYFADELDSEDNVATLDIANRGTFSATGNSNTRDYQIQFPVNGGPQLNFNYAIDASWDEPDPSGAPDYPIESFPPGAQIHEAYHISVCDAGSDAFYITDPGGSASGGNIRIDIEVFDWQAFGSPSGVPGEIDALWLEGAPLAIPVDILPLAATDTGGTGTSSVFHVDLDSSNLNLTSSGTFNILGTVESADQDTYMPQLDGGENFIFPDAPLAAYFMSEITVSDQTPQFTLDSPNGSEMWAAGSTQEITWHGAEVIDPVTLEYSKDDFVSDVNEIVAGTENDGSYTWDSIPVDTSDTVLVRVRSTDYSWIYDDSDNYFSIVSALDEMIVYYAQGPAAGRQIYSIDPEGVGPPEQWTDSTSMFVECAKLSPCGGYILYSTMDWGASCLRIIDISTDEDINITPSGYHALYGDFSHDGTTIVTGVGTSWFGPFELWTMDYDGGNAQQLTSGADAWGPEYNYDDTKIYYERFADEIYIYDVASGVSTQYTSTGTWNNAPHGSPDGTQIIWSTAYGNSCRWAYISPIGSWNPWDKIVNFDSCIRSPCFNPDGTKIVVDHGSMAASEIAIYDLTDDTWVDITNNAWADNMADWGVMIPH